MKNNSVVSIGFGPLLFLVFLVLKLTGYISWSWWFVTMPLWGLSAVVIVALVGFLISVAGLAVLLKVWTRVSEARAQHRASRYSEDSIYESYQQARSRVLAEQRGGESC